MSENKPLLTHAERMILRRISRASIDEPISINELKGLTRLSDRIIKYNIENLRRKGVCIVAVRAKEAGKRTGYFIPKDDAEREIGLAPFIRQIKSEMEVLNIIKSADLTAHEQLLEAQ